MKTFYKEFNFTNLIELVKNVLSLHLPSDSEIYQAPEFRNFVKENNLGKPNFMTYESRPGGFNMDYWNVRNDVRDYINSNMEKFFPADFKSKELTNGQKRDIRIKQSEVYRFVIDREFQKMTDIVEFLLCNNLEKEIMKVEGLAETIATFISFELHPMFSQYFSKIDHIALKVLKEAILPQVFIKEGAEYSISKKEKIKAFDKLIGIDKSRVLDYFNVSLFEESPKGIKENKELAEIRLQNLNFILSVDYYIDREEKEEMMFLKSEIEKALEN